MQTIKVDIIDNNAIKLLEDMELLQLIHLHKDEKDSIPATNWTLKYKGAMSKQPLSEIDHQLNDLRNGWE